MLRLLLSEIKYQLKSKNFIIIPLALSLLFALAPVYVFVQSQMTYRGEYAADQTEVKADNSGLIYVDNAQGKSVKESQTDIDADYARVTQDKQQIALQAGDLNPARSLGFLLGFGVGAAGLYFSIVGALLSCTDYRKKAIKSKAVSYSRNRLLIAKQLSFLLVIIYSLVIALALNYALSSILYNCLPQSIRKISTALSSGLFTKGNWAIQGLGCLVAAILYGQFGFLCGFLFKNPIIGMVLPLIDDLFLPILGTYDPQNISATFMNAYVNPSGYYAVKQPLPGVQPAIAAIVLIGAFVVMVAISFIVNRRRSLYV
jgi:hypothetical protein